MATQILKKIASNTTQTLLFNSVPEGCIVLNKNAKLTIIAFLTEGFEEKKSLHFELNGSGAELDFLCIIFGEDKNQFTFETFVHHNVPETKANFLIKAALFDHSVVDYKGNILIEKKAQLSDSYLAHHTLLLSDFARARTIPALEIEADDVKAGHAATIGKVDEEMMFYLKSRGIEYKEAEQMLISSFFSDEINKIKDTDIKHEIEQKLLKKLSQKLHLNQLSYEY